MNNEPLQILSDTLRSGKYREINVLTSTNGYDIIKNDDGTFKIFSSDGRFGESLEEKEFIIAKDYHDIRKELNLVIDPIHIINFDQDKNNVLYQRNDYSNQNDCGICYQSLDNEKIKCKLPQCNHIFHCHCIQNLINYGITTCPICRAAFIPGSQVMVRLNYDQYKYYNQESFFGKTKGYSFVQVCKDIKYLKI